jgi:hypothetical protein
VNNPRRPVSDRLARPRVVRATMVDLQTTGYLVRTAV